jgi:hypothetical protein
VKKSTISSRVNPASAWSCAKPFNFKNFMTCRGFKLGSRGILQIKRCDQGVVVAGNCLLVFL